MRTRAAVLALGMIGAGLVAAAGPAEAATPSCWTYVIGVNGSNKVVNRILHGTQQTKQWVSADALAMPAESIVSFGAEDVPGGTKSRYHVYYPGRRPAEVDVTKLDASPTLSTKLVGLFSRASSARHVTGGAKYFGYGVDARGNLKRWMRLDDGTGHQYLGDARLVARNMGGIRSLSYVTSFKTSSGWRDVLYGTTRAGALKQFQIPWRSPGRPKITVLRKTGFAAVTGLSLSACGTNPAYASLIAIDRTHNRARWYTLRSSFNPKPSNLVNRGLVARGADWRLHATS
ncbi:MAG: hypothetical protein J7518_16170 [Nocardioidaceae bacterium]|nr:hypothetical protein [Nocardioidaceae bacterium]